MEEKDTDALVLCTWMARRLAHTQIMAMEHVSKSSTMSANSEVFIVSALLNLINLEKSFKKYQKNGYRAISVKDNEITAYPQSWTDEQIKKMAAGAELFFSLQDFVK